MTDGLKLKEGVEIAETEPYKTTANKIAKASGKIQKAIDQLLFNRYMADIKTLQSLGFIPQPIDIDYETFSSCETIKGELKMRPHSNGRVYIQIELEAKESDQ